VKLPRNVSGDGLIRTLARFGYVEVRRKGSHVRLKHPGPPPHLLTVPRHTALKTGTLHGILAEIANARDISIEALLDSLT